MKTRPRNVVFGLVAIVLALLLVEGVSSTLVFVYDVARWSRSVGERGVEGQYDEELGWVPRANLELPDFYGPGNSLETNSLGFRNDRETTNTIPAGKFRWVCLGDSFTYGEGVGNRSTWVSVLESLDDRLETVNMGVAGYGVDQAYLRYLRDAGDIDHDLVVFAFISADFERIRSDSFYAFGKPRLEIRNSELAVTNVPVPHHGVVRRWLAYNDDIVGKLGLVEVIRRLASATSLSTAVQGGLLTEEQVYEVADKLFDDLNRVSRERGSSLVLVHMPVLDEPLTGLAQSLPRFLSRVSSEKGIELIDLVTPFRELPRAEIGELFIDPEDAVHESDAEHYSVRGHQQVAAMLYEGLAEILAAGSDLHAEDAPKGEPGGDGE